MYWWRRPWPGHTRPGYPPVALVVTGAGPVALANRQQAVADLARHAWGGSWWTITRHDNHGDGWREYDDGARYSLLDALESPDTRRRTTSARRPGRRRPAKSTAS